MTFLISQVVLAPPLIHFGYLLACDVTYSLSVASTAQDQLSELTEKN